MTVEPPYAIRYVVAGQVVASERPLELRTVLGSCVSACLFDPIARVGGMNHFMLPDSAGASPTARYGGDAMAILIDSLVERGADPRRLQAKVFGGCATLSLSSGGATVGDQNAAFVRRYLDDRRIPTVACCLDRERAIRLRFWTDTGRALIQRIVPGATAVERPALNSVPAYSLPTNPVAPVRTFSRAIVAIGASTGGTDALMKVLSALPADAPPIVAVQHMPPGYTESFAETLDRKCRITVREARDGDVIEPGKALLAPGGVHMEVRRAGGHNVVRLRNGPRVNRFRPSVDVLFNSCAREFKSRVVAAILTGMGNDGARGLLALREAGSYTIAQNEATSVVFGMPRHAIEIGAAARVLPLQHISHAILQAVERIASKGGSRGAADDLLRR